MCVAGLPNPQEQHALIMAKFAYDCLLKMNDATCGLVDKLGEGTEQLSLRIGLVSARHASLRIQRYLLANVFSPFV